MQRIHATTEPENEHVALVTYALGDAIFSTPEQAKQAAEASQSEQEQSAEVEKLLASLEQDTKKRQKWNRWLLAILLAYSLSLLILIPIMWLTHHKVGWLFRLFQLSNFINVIGYALGGLFLDKKSAVELAQLNDVRCTGALTDIWGSQGTINYAKRTREQARGALIRLLPQMKASDAPLLRETQRAALRGVLAHAGNANSLKEDEVEFTLAILKAFEQVGDWKSASYVKTLTGPANPKRIRAAAKECLPYLQALAEKQQPGENLLRASSASEAAGVAPDTLLRPALGAEEARPDTLLRASGDETT